MEGHSLPFPVGRLSSSIRTATAAWVGCHRCRIEAQVYSCCSIQASQGGHAGDGADSCISSPVPCPPHLCLYLCSLLPHLYLTNPVYLTCAPPPHLDSTHLTWALSFLTGARPHLTHDQSSISGSHDALSTSRWVPCKSAHNWAMTDIPAGYLVDVREMGVPRDWIPLSHHSLSPSALSQGPQTLVQIDLPVDFVSAQHPTIP